MSSRIDPAFRNIPPNKPGFYVWRIEKLKVVPVPKDQYGVFYKGDSYIVLSLTEIGGRKGTTRKAMETKGSLEMNIHFWLGSETSQDEAGTAAIKSVELDDQMGGFPTQFREVEGYESDQFKKYFKSRGLEYKKGGVASGFSHVEHKFSSRLLRIKGKRSPVASEVDLSWSSFNHGDCFILETMSFIFVWNGKMCSRAEKLTAFKKARQLRDARGAQTKANLECIEDGEESQLLDKEKKGYPASINFKKIFEDNGLSLKNVGQVKSKEEGGEDVEEESSAKAEIKLYCMREENDTLTIFEVKSGPLKYSDLDPKDAFIVDNGRNGVWLWTGKQASQKERKEGMRRVMGFIGKKQMSSNTQVKTTNQDAEPEDFKWLFSDWPAAKYSGKVYKRDKIARQVQTKFDASTLHSNTQLAAETQMPDDGSGRVEVWRVEGPELVPLEKKYMGEFFGGDSYVIHYTYKGNRGKSNHIIYYWLGLHSPPLEQGTAAKKAVELDDKLNSEKGEDAVQVRVVQGKETQHFMAIFEGKMIIFEGGTQSTNKDDNQVVENKSHQSGPGDRYMLQVRGTSVFSTQAFQVPMRAASLNSNDAFVVVTKTSVHIWAGAGCTGDEREMAKKICTRYARSPTLVAEGQEKKEFWDILGGKEVYATSKRLADPDPIKPPRLFQVSNASGQLRAEEIREFDQIDLIADDVMILDAWDCLYIWIGKGANKQEKEGAVPLATEYVKTDPSPRDESIPMYYVKQGCEPPTFTGFFGAWDIDMWKREISYEEMVKQAKEGNDLLIEVDGNSLSNGSENFETVPKYSLEELQEVEVPSGVDPTCKEIHLEKSQFEQLFGMPYADFQSLAAWKQKQMKQKFKLF